MKCANCKKDINIKIPLGLAKAEEIKCPHCNTLLTWKRDWIRGIFTGFITGVMFYLLGMLLREKTFIIAFPIAGVILGVLFGSRKLVVV